MFHLYLSIKLLTGRSHYVKIATARKYKRRKQRTAGRRKRAKTSQTTRRGSPISSPKMHAGHKLKPAHNQGYLDNTTPPQPSPIHDIALNTVHSAANMVGPCQVSHLSKIQISKSPASDTREPPETGSCHTKTTCMIGGGNPSVNYRKTTARSLSRSMKRPQRSPATNTPHLHPDSCGPRHA
jgi:hypothetical protein